MMKSITPTRFWKSLLRQPLIPIGLVVALLGAIGLGYELLRPSEEEIFEELIIAYDDDMGFAPFFAGDLTTPTPANSETQGSNAAGDSSADPAPTATPDPNTAHAVLGYLPDSLQIPSINLDAPVVTVDHVEAELNGVNFTLWLAPRGYRAGWHSSSSLLGLGGNTVLNGHHNAYEMVFEHLIDVEEGDLVIVSSGEVHFEYIVTIKVIFPERFETFEARMANTVWIEPTTSERITLVTCWPATSNTHRLIIVAEPYMPDADDLGDPE